MSAHARERVARTGMRHPGTHTECGGERWVRWQRVTGGRFATDFSSGYFPNKQMTKKWAYETTDRALLCV